MNAPESPHKPWWSRSINLSPGFTRVLRFIGFVLAMEAGLSFSHSMRTWKSSDPSAIPHETQLPESLVAQIDRNRAEYMRQHAHDSTATDSTGRLRSPYAIALANLRAERARQHAAENDSTGRP